MGGKRIGVCLVLFIALHCAASANALDEHIVVKPGDARVCVTADPTENGRVRFTIRRDLSGVSGKAHRGWLTVASDAGLLAECAVEATARGKEIIYTFDLTSAGLAHSSFLLREYVKPEEGEELQLGGATVFEIRPATFVDIRPDARS
jgi:hypothetical protein